MGHIPVGMEMFSAADEEQWKIIARQIEECDYYVVIVAHRYGSIVDNISYTEKEFDYADQQEVPSIAFIIEDEATWPGNKIENDSSKKEALDLFKEKLRGKLIGSWNNKDDLYGQVAISLMKLFNTNARPGWTRADEIVGPDVINELTRLSEENATLRKRALVSENIQTKNEETERNNIINILVKNELKLSFYYEYGSKWESGPTIDYFDLFYLIAPYIMIEDSTAGLSKFIAIIFNENKNRNLRNDWPTSKNRIRSLIADFVSLDLITPSKKQHSIADKDEYWTLTEKGQNIYSHIRRTKLEKGTETISPLVENESITEHEEDDI